MKKIIIKETENTPGVLIDYKKKAIKFKGRITTNETNEFWEPLFLKIDEFLNYNVRHKITVSFLLYLFSTANKNYLNKFFFKLKEKIDSGSKIEIKWFYEENDEDILYDGELFSEINEIPIQLSIVGGQTTEIKESEDAPEPPKFVPGDKMIIRRTKDTPSVNLNPAENIFEFEGDSWCLDAYTFYREALAWFKHYFENQPLQTTVIDFKFGYLNTSSSKQLAVIFDYLRSQITDNKIILKWYYDEGDTDMEEEGHRYEKLLNIYFEYIEIPLEEYVND